MTQETVPTSSPVSMNAQGNTSSGGVVRAWSQDTHKTSWYVPWVVAFLAWGIGVFMFFILASNNTWFAWRQFVARYVLQSEYVALTNSIFERNQYIVGKIKLKKPGFAVLYFGNQYDLGIRNPIAFTNLLLPGEYKNIQIKADEARIQAEDLALYKRGATLYVVLYHDEGNGIFNVMSPESPRDPMVMDSLGNPVVAKLTIQ